MTRELGLAGYQLIPPAGLHAASRTEHLMKTNKPMGIAECQLAEALPKDLEADLPSIEQVERVLAEASE